MRILLCTDVTTRGGVDGYVLDLASALTRAGHEPILAIEETTTSALRETAQNVPGLPLHHTAMYHRRHDSRRLREASETLIEQVAPDGIHVVCGSPFSCLTLREAAARHTVRTVITEQQIRCDLLLSAREAARIWETYRAATCVVFVSEGNQATMSRLLCLDSVTHTVIPNGVDVAHIEVRTRNGSRRRVGAASIMTAARFAREKGLDVLVHAVAALPESVVGRADLYGEGAERDGLQQLIVELGMERRVTLHPWGSDVPEQMAQHDVFVLPSRSEGMPYALLEAMAAGIPIVASDVPGNIEALGAGGAGSLVPQGDVAALATAIRTRLGDPDGTARLVQQAGERVQALYDLSAQMQRTVSLWASD